MTHIENIPHILRNGITNKDSNNRNQNYKNIGDISLIKTRTEKSVKIDNGIDDLRIKPKCIKLGDYIPFNFGVRMPMLYVSQQGGNFVEQATSPENIIYLVCSLCDVVSLSYKFIFTDGHATDMLTSFYDESKINELVNIIDWNAVTSLCWGGNDNLDIKRKKQAEFLIAGDIPPELIVGFGCYNKESSNKLISFGITENKIKIIPNAYY